MEYLNQYERNLITLVFYSPMIMAFLIGMVIGSLSNVVIHRLPYFRSLWSPKSHCTSCGTEIPWYHNIPLVSYLVLKGRCRYCGAKFSVRYFMVELLSGLLYILVIAWIYTLPMENGGFGLTYRQVFTFDLGGTPPLGFSPNIVTMLFMFKGFIFCSFLLILTIIDLEHELLPDRITIPGVVIGLALAVIAPLDRPTIASLGTSGALDAVLQSIIGLLVGGGFLFILYLFGGMGGGDWKLMAMIGAFVGIKALGPTMFVGFVAGGVIGGILLLFKRATRKSKIPFGPFLAFGGLVGFFWGHKILNWYFVTFAGGGGPP